LNLDHIYLLMAFIKFIININGILELAFARI